MLNLIKNFFVLLCAVGLSVSVCEGNIFKPNGKNYNNNQNNGWNSYTFDTSGFSVDLPVKPDHIKQSIAIPNTQVTLQYDTYVSEPSPNVVYVISVWKYPKDIDMSSSEINLQDGFNGMLSALPKAEVQKMQIGKEQGFNALEFLVKSENINFQGKLILVHNTLYQVFTVYKASEDMAQNYQRFINSFQLKNTDEQRANTPANSARQKLNV